MTLNKIFFVVSLFYISSGIAIAHHGGLHWFTLDETWRLYHDNGKLYLKAENLAGVCNYNRAWLDMNYGDDFYRKSTYAYVLSSFVARKKNMSITISDLERLDRNGTGDCKFRGVNALE